MYKRITALILALFVTASLAGCNGGSQPSQQQDAPSPAAQEGSTGDAPSDAPETTPAATEGSITIWFGSWWEDAAPQIIEWFERDNPGVTLEIECLPINGYFDNAVSAILAGSPPDVIDLDATQISSFADQNLLLPLADVKSQLVVEDIAPGVFSICHYQDEVYAIPSRSSAEVFYYNMDMFDALEIPYPEEGWSFDDMLELAQQLTVPGQYGVGIAAAISDPLNVMSSFAPCLWAFGGDFVDDGNTQCLLDTPESIAAISYWTGLYTEHKVVPEGTINYSTSNDIIPMFINNQVAMFASGENGMATLRDAEAEGGPRWGLLLGPDGVSRAGGWAFVVPVTAASPDLAKQFILWYQDPDIMKHLSVRMPPNANAFDAEPWNAPEYEVFREAAMRAKSLPTFGKWSDAQNIVIKELQNILEETKTPEEGAADMVEQINALL